MSNTYIPEKSSVCKILDIYALIKCIFLFVNLTVILIYIPLCGRILPKYKNEQTYFAKVPLQQFDKPLLGQHTVLRDWYRNSTGCYENCFNKQDILTWFISYCIVQ